MSLLTDGSNSIINCKGIYNNLQYHGNTVTISFNKFMLSLSIYIYYLNKESSYVLTSSAVSIYGSRTCSMAENWAACFTASLSCLLSVKINNINQAIILVKVGTIW